METMRRRYSPSDRRRDERLMHNAQQAPQATYSSLTMTVVFGGLVAALYTALDETGRLLLAYAGVVFLVVFLIYWFFKRFAEEFRKNADLRRLPYFERPAVEALKKQLKENIKLRQAARKVEKSYEFKKVKRQNSPASTLLDMIPQGLFIDKTESYKTVLDVSQAHLGVCFATYPRRCGKTTWLQFVEYILGALWNVNKDRTKLFYDSVAALKEGRWFLEQPLRPVISVTMLECSKPETLLNQLKEQFQAHGVQAGPSVDFGSYLHFAPTTLKNLYETAIGELAQEEYSQRHELLNVRDEVNSEILILMDEYDFPFRELEYGKKLEYWAWYLCIFPPLRRRLLPEREGYYEVTRCLGVWCRCIKALLEKSVVWGTCIISLVPLGQTGLSDLPLSEVLTLRKKYHEFFGISERELSTALEDHASTSMSLDRVLDWASKPDINICTPLATRTRRTGRALQRKEFFDWLRDNVNEFCMALDIGDSGHIPVYSPLDALTLLQYVEDSGKEIPPLMWFSQSKNIYGPMLAARVDRKQLRDAMLGGTVDQATFTQSRIEHFYKSGTQAPLILLFYLGLLQVSYSNKEKLVLTPSDDARNLEFQIDLLSGYFPPPGNLSNREVNRLSANPELLLTRVIDCVNTGAERISRNNADFLSKPLREIPFQAAVYHMIAEQLSHPEIKVSVEKQIMGRKRIDIIVKLGEFYVIIENKMRGKNRLETKMREAIEQARGYRKRLRLRTEACILVAAVMDWDTPPSVYTQHSGGPMIRQEDMRRHICLSKRKRGGLWELGT
eukprot:gb/GECG01013882.1/.p1 GENE.gb/GECG01013882.1/~~gb/GECG01013882.1/.p1  ORF type:complete len:786 (+),score=66.83 gb/GECG01013882.1/:1-2358(+)